MGGDFLLYADTMLRVKDLFVNMWSQTLNSRDRTLRHLTNVKRNNPQRRLLIPLLNHWRQLSMFPSKLAIKLRRREGKI